ncbi:MAG TPA: hypothetical protein VFR80_15060 [Pyrinomonadaceae bacterium]|nr:hypothetical protein [Pyrinomonadaceae bacterium]
MMNNDEAISLLAREMEHYRAKPYAELIQLLDETRYIETTGPSGTPYQVELSVVWDDKSKGDLRVIGSIDDGGWRAFVPITDSFILRPDGTFVGE